MVTNIERAKLQDETPVQVTLCKMRLWGGEGTKNCGMKSGIIDAEFMPNQQSFVCGKQHTLVNSFQNYACSTTL